MRIYKAEKKDNIDFKINKNGNSASFVTAKVHVGDIKQCSIANLANATESVQTIRELLGQEQPDLALIVAILVSTGWNDNDDVFTPDELWKARSTPLHKPMNDNHMADQILGHIVQSRVLDKSGDEIDSNVTTPPNEFDIEVAGVLYRAFPELSERIDDIITKAKNGEIFVSMECWFPDFGYGFIDPSTGKTKLLKRDESTAFLTKHLRIYGGTGKYQGYRIGRVLENMIFGAQGFVDTPANPDSVIKVAANKMAVSHDFVSAKLTELEGGVQDVDEKEIKELQVKLEEAQASLESKTKEVVELQKVAKDVGELTVSYDEQITILTKKVDELTASAVEASEKMKEVEVSKTELQKQFDEVTVRAEKSETELDEIRKTETAHDRFAKLSDVKKIDDKDATMAELKGMSDEMFAVVLKYAGEVKAKEVVADESEKKTDTTDSAEAALNDVKETDEPDLSVTKDAKQSENEEWVATARSLCGHVDEKD